jgi:aminotransferase
MTRVANQWGSINLSQGYPDFDPPDQLKEALAKAAYAGPHQYAITWGAENFRIAFAAKQKHFMASTSTRPPRSPSPAVPTKR